MNEHLPSLALWSQPLSQFSYLEFVTGRGGERGEMNAIHTHHYFHYHGLHYPLCIKPIISSIFHIILTHLAELL